MKTRSANNVVTAMVEDVAVAFEEAKVNLRQTMAEWISVPSLEF
jgi:hypothetical protein